MIKISHLVAALLFALISVAHAETADAPDEQTTPASMEDSMNNVSDSQEQQSSDDQTDQNQSDQTEENQGNN